MNALYSILQVLRPGEVQLIKHYYSRPVNAENKMRLALLNLIIAKSDLSNTDAIQLLNPKMSASAFSHLKSRLRSDMLNALLWQESGKRFSEASKAAEFECTRNIAQAYVLMMRGSVTEGNKILERSKKLAEQFELVSHRFVINQLIRRRLHSIKNGKELQRINAELASDLKNTELLNETEEKTLVIAAPNLFSKDATELFRKHGEDIVTELGKNYKDTSLSRVGFWYLMAATEFYRNSGEHEKMLDYGIEFYNLVNQSAALRSDTNISGVSQTVGVALMKLHRFKEAEEYLEISVKKFRNGGMNHLNSLDLLFKAQLAVYGTYRAKTTADSGKSHRQTLNSERLQARWNYYRACREFLSSKPDESYSTLNSNGDLMKWRDDYNVQFRILEVLQLIELEDLDWVDFKLDTLRKFVSRNRKLKTPRIDAIIKILYAMHTKSYRLDRLNKSTLKLIDRLHTDEKGWAWNPIGNELVRFDAWLERRMG